jgi:hypothetical protein
MFNTSNNIITNHEIACPENQAIKKFLWESYFHDSEIDTIAFDTDNDSLNITVTSIEDIDEAWDSLKGSRTQRRKYIKDNKALFQYELIFENCVDFSHEAVEIGSVFLQCYFLNSAKLKRYHKKYNNDYYHFRILTTSGLMDIVFADFKIHKVSNEDISYENLEDYSDDYWMTRFQDYLKRNDYLLEDGRPDTSILKEHLKHGSDRERCIALYYFVNYTDVKVIDFAKDMLGLDRDKYELSRHYIIKVIGLQGSLDDMPLLMQEYMYLENKYYDDGECLSIGILAKKQVRDAIEMICLTND